MHVHEPLGQLVNEQCAPAAHCSVQPPPAQSIVHVDPVAHADKHEPDEHATLQVAPAGHDVLQPPAEQPMLHVPPPQ